MQIIKTITILSLIQFVIGCGSHQANKRQDEPKQSYRTEAVKRNAQLALKECGKGNVKEVSVDGYYCKSER